MGLQPLHPDLQQSLRASCFCGHSVKLMQHLIGQTPTVLVHFKPGYDLYNRTLATANPTSGTDIYFTKVPCATGNADIFKVTAP